MTAANKKYQQLKRKVHAIEAWKHTRDEEKILPANITTNEVKCQSCGFKARYQFIRCPECNEVQK